MNVYFYFYDLIRTIHLENSTDNVIQIEVCKALYIHAEY